MKHWSEQIIDFLNETPLEKVDAIHDAFLETRHMAGYVRTTERPPMSSVEVEQRMAALGLVKG